MKSSTWIRVGALSLVAVVSTACGEEEAPPAKAKAPVAAGAAAAGAASQPGRPGAKTLTPMKHVEDRVVTCPSPPPTKQCDPNLPSACKVEEGKPNEYCLETTAGWFCGTCLEKDSIRYTLRPRDFEPTGARDPFESYVINQTGGGTGDTALPRDETKRCAKPDQVRVASYSFSDLVLVGIIKVGLQRKVLMMDPGTNGHVIARGECVGKEKALVKDFGEDRDKGPFVLFEIPPDSTQGVQRPAAEVPKYLDPNARLSMNRPMDRPGSSTGPAVVAPPPPGGAVPPPPAPGTSPTEPAPAPPPPASNQTVPAPPSK